MHQGMAAFSVTASLIFWRLIGDKESLDKFLTNLILLVLMCWTGPVRDGPGCVLLYSVQVKIRIFRPILTKWKK